MGVGNFGVDNNIGGQLGNECYGNKEASDFYFHPKMKIRFH